MQAADSCKLGGLRAGLAAFIRDMGRGPPLVNWRFTAHVFVKIDPYWAIAKESRLRNSSGRFRRRRSPYRVQGLSSLRSRTISNDRAAIFVCPPGRGSGSAVRAGRRLATTALGGAVVLPLSAGLLEGGLLPKQDPAPAASASDPTVARVNGVDIRESDLAMAEQDIGQNLQNAPPRDPARAARLAYRDRYHSGFPGGRRQQQEAVGGPRFQAHHLAFILRCRRC